MNSPPLQIVVLISGTGRSLKNLIDLSESGELPATIGAVISSRPSAGGLLFAEQSGIPSHVVRRRDFDSGQDHCDGVFDICRQYQADLVVMAGYLQHVLIPADYENRVINIHPSLIPNFCGKGMYGNYVHQAVLEAGASETGCTVHWVDNEYDHGPILLQRAVNVHPNDTVATLAGRVFEAELEALPEAIRQIAAQM